MKLRYILLAVAVGVVYGAFQPGRLAHAFGESTLYIFLPALLFEAAWNLHYRAILRRRFAIAVLAGPGVAITAAIVAGTLVLIRVPVGPAVLAGAILSATDPIAVVAVFRRVKVPDALRTIVECEALFNDAVAVAIYRGVLATLVLSGASAGTTTWIAFMTLGGVIGGIIAGVATAFIVASALRGRTHAGLQIAATTVCAYGAYFAADFAHLSGIFATIACGIALRHFERSWVSLTAAENVERFWDAAATIANVLVFFLLGAALQFAHVVAAPIFALMCLAGILIARVVVSNLLLLRGYPREWIDVVRAAGMRGGLCPALALAIPSSIPYRAAIIDATFAVSIATLAISGVTLMPVVRRIARPR